MKKRSLFSNENISSDPRILCIIKSMFLGLMLSIPVVQGMIAVFGNKIW